MPVGWPYEVLRFSRLREKGRAAGVTQNGQTYPAGCPIRPKKTLHHDHWITPHDSSPSFVLSLLLSIYICSTAVHHFVPTAGYCHVPLAKMLIADVPIMTLYVPGRVVQ